MSAIESYAAWTCDDLDQDFEGRGIAITIGSLRLELSLTRRARPRSSEIFRHTVAASAAGTSDGIDLLAEDQGR